MRAQQSRPASPLRGETAPSLSTSPTGSLKPSISQFLVREDSGTRSITSLTPSVSSVTEYAGSIADSDITTTKEPETMPSSVDLDKEETPSAEHQIDSISPEPVAPIGSPSIREPSPARSPQLVERPSSIAGSDRSSHMPQLSEQKSIPERPKSHLEEPYDFSYLEPKPKVKLGPRPVVTPERPRKSNTMGTSLLPTGYHAKKQEQQRPKSTGPVNYVQSQMLAGLTTFPTPPPIPDVPEYNPRPISRGSVKSMPSQKSTTMTPEKLRLMKAVELRRKQMRKSNPQIRTPAPIDEAPEMPNVPRNLGARQIERSASPQPVGVVSQPQKLDSGIDLEHDRRMEEERSAPLATPNRSTGGGEVISGEPAGLLSSPAVTSNTTSQQSDPIVNANAHVKPSEAITDREQVGGAESSLVPSHHKPISDDSRAAAFVPTSEPELKHVEAAAEEATAPPVESVPVNAGAINQNIDETTFSTSNENLITDVPAIVTTASSRPPTAHDETNTTISRSPSPGIPSSMESSGNLAVETEMSDLAKRRRGLVEPLHIDVETRRNSDAESLDDPDFLEELQSATFHDAKEMVVSKSPGPSTPFFPPHLARSMSRESMSSRSRSSVKEVRVPSYFPRAESPPADVSPEVIQPHSRKSSNSVSPIERHSPVASLKRNVSSGITKRIQALNELSNREPSAVPVHIPSRALSPDPAPVFLANDRSDRRPSMRSPHSRTGSSYRLRPSADRAGSVPNGSQQAEIPHVWSTSQHTTSNRDSVSVKARIVRPPTAGSVENPTENVNDLHESQIEINHSRGISTPTPVSQAFLPPMPSIPANPPSPDHRSLHSLRRKSFGRSKASTPGPVPATEDVRSGAASIVSAEENSGSRTSRFFKRMSNFGNTSSKRRSVVTPVPSTVVSPTPTESSASRAASVATDRDTPPAVQVGDLNVQFPDTLVSHFTILPSSPARN
jgi:hypothetical protein